MSNRPFVLLLSASLLAQGGVETFLLSLTESLKEQFDFHLLAPSQEQFIHLLDERGLRHTHWPVKGFFDRYSLAMLKEFLRTHRPDLVHIQDARAAFLARPLLAQLGIPSIYSAHLPSYYYSWGGVNRFLRPVLYAIIESILNHTTPCQMVFVGHSAYKQAIQWHIAPAKRAICIPNGVDLAPYNNLPFSEARSLRASLGISDDTSVICSVGRLSVQKNPQMLIQAVAHLWQQGLQVQLWMVGEGPERLNLEILIKQLNLQHAIKLWGSRADVPLLLTASDIFTLASKYEAGHTLAVMEAQAAGLPCILSDVGDHAEMVHNSGLTFPDGDFSACMAGLRFLIENPAERISQGERARYKAFQAYDLQYMAGQYGQVYRSLL